MLAPFAEPLALFLKPGSTLVWVEIRYQVSYDGRGGGG